MGLLDVHVYTVDVGNVQAVTKIMGLCCLKYTYMHLYLGHSEMGYQKTIMYICTMYIVNIGESKHHYNQDISMNILLSPLQPYEQRHLTNQDTSQIRTPH